MKGITNGATVGLDLGDKRSQVFVVSGEGERIAEFGCRTTATGLQRGLSRYGGCRVVMEVGAHSPWVSRLLGSSHEVIVANPRRVRLIAESLDKDDCTDAELLARLGRADPLLLRPIEHRGEEAQRDLQLLRTRDGLVRARTQLINELRGSSKALGMRLPKSSSEAFARRMESVEADARFPGFDTVVGVVEQLTKEIRGLDREIDRVSQERYPETQLLRQVKGVGPITALAFVLTVEDPERFAKSRAVGPYFGLRPKRRNSGDRRPQLRITKAGDEFVRRLLVNAAHYILGPFGPDTDLRRFGLRLAERGGQAGKKRAIVAVARKLAVLLHRLWRTGEVYEPVGYGRVGAEGA